MKRFQDIVIASALSWAVLGSGALALVDDPVQLEIHDAKKAQFHWQVNCRGCHGVKGYGSAGGAPPMPGVLSKLLSVDGGREYLARVPGVVNAPLDDADLADLLNWVMLTFTCEPLPTEFRGYDAVEVGALRKKALVTDAHLKRAELLSKLGDSGASDGLACATGE